MEMIKMESEEQVQLELDYGMKDGEVREAIQDNNTKALDLTNLPIKIDIEDIDSVIEKSNEEFAIMRRNGLGGSDSSSVLGVNPFTTRQQLIQQKARDTLTEEEKEVGEKVAVRKGRDLEPLIIQKTEKAFNIDVFKPKDMYRFKAYPWLTMNFDGVVENDDGTYYPNEIKVVTLYGQKHYNFNKAFYDETQGMLPLPENYAASEINSIETKAMQYGIPPYYYTQLQQEMLALNSNYGILSVLRDSDWRLFSFYVHRDPFVQSRLITEGYKVWEEIEKLNPKRKLDANSEL
jgi:hypothetical protein